VAIVEILQLSFALFKNIEPCRSHWPTEYERAWFSDTAGSALLSRLLNRRRVPLYGIGVPRRQLSPLMPDAGKLILDLFDGFSVRGLLKSAGQR